MRRWHLQVNVHGNNLLTPAQAWALLCSTEWPPVQLLQGTDSSTNCLHDAMSGGSATQRSHSFLEVIKRDAEEMSTCEWETGHLSNSKTLRLE